MKERPLLLNGEMVKAVLDGRKTQTRRIISKKVMDDMRIAQKIGEVSDFYDSGYLQENDESYIVDFAPLGKVGDRLYVRETFQLMDDSPKGKDMAGIPDGRFMGNPAPWKGVQGDRPITWRPVFRADGELVHPEYGKVKWKPSIHMPKWAARIWFEITGVRVERVQDISKEDVYAEGTPHDERNGTWYLRRQFETLWESCYPGSWERNDWVFAYDLK